MPSARLPLGAARLTGPSLVDGPGNPAHSGDHSGDMNNRYGCPYLITSTLKRNCCRPNGKHACYCGVVCFAACAPSMLVYMSGVFWVIVCHVTQPVSGAGKNGQHGDRWGGGEKS